MAASSVDMASCSRTLEKISDSHLASLETQLFATPWHCVSCGRCYFESEEEQRFHFKSDWHRYNLRRRVANVPPLSEEVFSKRVEALLSAPPASKGSSHIKSRRSNGKDMNTSSSGSSSSSSSSDCCETLKHIPTKNKSWTNDCTYTPTRSLFDSHQSPTLEKNIEYMVKKYSLFIPDKEYLVDLEGLVRYLGEKIYCDNQCIYCDKQLTSVEAVKLHMIDKGHTMIGTEKEEMLCEITPFYDYTESYKQLTVGSTALDTQGDNAHGGEMEDDDEWEYMSSPKPANTDNLKLDHIYMKCGLRKAAITERGDLALPNGRTVGNRNLAYVYRQRLKVAESEPQTVYLLNQKLALAASTNSKVVVSSSSVAISRNNRFGRGGCMVTSRRAVPRAFNRHALIKYKRDIHMKTKKDNYRRMKLGMSQNKLPKYVFKREMFCE